MDTNKEMDLSAVITVKFHDDGVVHKCPLKHVKNRTISVGDVRRVKWDDGKFYAAVIKKIVEGGRIEVEFKQDKVMYITSISSIYGNNNGIRQGDTRLVKWSDGKYYSAKLIEIDLSAVITVKFHDDGVVHKCPLKHVKNRTISVGDVRRVKWDDGKFYAAVIKKIVEGGRIEVEFKQDKVMYITSISSIYGNNNGIQKGDTRLVKWSDGKYYSAKLIEIAQNKMAASSKTVPTSRNKLRRLPNLPDADKTGTSSYNTAIKEQEPLVEATQPTAATTVPAQNINYDWLDTDETGTNSVKMAGKEHEPMGNTTQPAFVQDQKPNYDVRRVKWDDGKFYAAVIKKIVEGGRIEVEFKQDKVMYITSISSIYGNNNGIQKGDTRLVKWSDGKYYSAKLIEIAQNKMAASSKTVPTSRNKLRRLPIGGSEMSVKAVRVSVPLGMDAAIEGLARAVLREQPSDIYLFAAEHFENLVRKRELSQISHNSGISPSSTQESNSKQAASEEGQPLKDDKSFAEEPESNDTSYGVEATAVRTLAASTGTVAILGTTAKTGDVSPSAVDTILEEQEENGERTLETAQIHIEESAKNLPSRPNSSKLDNKEKSIEQQVTSPISNTELIKEVPPSESLVAKESSPNDDAPLTTAEEPKSPEKEAATHIEENSSEPIVSELAKEKEEDLSKSISSERLKTNSISNTTLSSDSIVELDNGSVKQSPSADKVLESFDSSSTVEFVDAPKDFMKSLVQDDRTNPAISISSELSNKANLPLDGEKTPEVTSSPIESDVKVEADDLLPPPPQEDSEESLELTKSNGEKSSLEEVTKESSEGDQDINTNSSSKDLVNDEVSLTSEISSNISSSIQSIVKNEPNKQENDSKSAIENSSPNVSESNKAGTDSPLSSDNNSSFNDNGDNGASPVTAVILSPAPTSSESKKEEIIVPDKDESAVELTNGISSKNETPTDSNSVRESIENDTPKDIKSEIIKDLEISKEEKIPQVNGETAEDLPIDLEDEKVIAAATAIQASFRGYQTRQNLKTEPTNVAKDQSIEVEDTQQEQKKSYEEIKQASIDLVNDITEQAISMIDSADDKMVAAATTIQANFRGFQTRQNLKNKLDSGLPPSEETIPPSEMSPALTPELIEAVKEEVDDICKEAEIIAAERAESADMLKGVQQVVVGVKDATLPSVSSIAAVRGSATPPSISLDIDDSKEEVFDPLIDVDEKAISAATTIQATFRGFQARKNINNKDTSDAMPDYPPPAAEDEYLQSLEDLPPPDFEALESSYSEDVPTEPLAPPPDSLVFNEEDEDALASLQKPQECDELPENRPATATQDTAAQDTSTQDTDSSESSLSSAATKIQAGVRGYLTRKQMQEKGATNTGGTTSTSTITSTVLDSDQSLSVSRDDEVQGVRSAISMDEESEVTRHMASPEVDTIQELVETEVLPRAPHSKRMSLTETPVTRQRAPLRTAMSVQVVSDDEVWNTLKEDMSGAATTIQSNFRGYRARKQLQREDAMQVTTSGSSQATPSSGSVDGGRGSAASNKDDKTTRSSGEFHDIIALSPPTLPAEGGGEEASAQTAADKPTDAHNDVMVKRRVEDDVKEAAAATKIQATFRGFKARQEMNQVDRAAAKIQAGFRGYKVRKEMKKEKSARVDSTEEHAATKIQAGVRGFLVRRRNLKEQQVSPKVHSRNQTPTDQ